MSDRDSSLHEAFAPPSAATSPEPEPSFDPRLARWHVVVLLVALVVHGLATTLMQVELFDAEPRWSADLFSVLMHTHGLSRYTILGPVVLGLLPMLVLPTALDIRCPRPRWLAYFAVVAWGAGTVVMVIPTRLELVLPVPIWGLLAVLLANVAYGVGLCVAVFGGGWAAFRRAPLTCLALGASAVGFGLLMEAEVSLAASMPPLMSFFDVLILGFVAAAPGVLVLALAATESRRRVADLRSVPGWALAVSVLGFGALPLSRLTEAGAPILVGVLAIPVLLFVTARALRPLIAAWREPDAIALLLALLALVLGSVDAAFLSTLSVDVHLHDTYFVTALFHLGAMAALLVLVAACMQQAPAWLSRAPRRGPAMAGVLGLGTGMLVSTVAMAMLGQQGMPRRYFTYVPQFESLHQWVGIGGALALAGLVLCGLSIAKGERTPLHAAEES